MKNSLNKMNDVMTNIASTIGGNKFKSYSDYEKLVKKMVTDHGGDKLQEALKSLPPLPNVEENFYKAIANKIREMVSIKFE